MNLNEKDEKERKRRTVAWVLEDFARRQKERRRLEKAWELNMNFVCGNQYCDIMPDGDVGAEEMRFGWQSRRVFNHIAPIVETRCAKLAEMMPTLCVRAAGAEEQDMNTAKLATDILRSVSEEVGLSSIVSKATNWSESCGTVFYKTVWDAGKGRRIGLNADGRGIYEGDVQVAIVPPFEIYPSRLNEEDINAQESLIHAKLISATEAFEEYGIEAVGKKYGEFALSPVSGYESSVKAFASGYCEREDAVLVIERYEKPTKGAENGRLTVVVGDELFFDGELPYQNGENGERCYPFVRQACMDLSGSFFGTCTVDRLVPVQRAYNAIRNRKHEFLNRIAMGVMTVEDGAVDVDDLVEDGVSPGKVIVYRQGANPPEMMNYGTVPAEFAEEEERLLDEFAAIGGVSEMTRSSVSPKNVTSATALQLLLEQENSRFALTLGSIKQAMRSVGKQILRLYKQFATVNRIKNMVSGEKTVKSFCFSASDITSDDVTIETESDLSCTPTQKRQMIYDLYKMGLFTDENGRVSNAVRMQVLKALGFGSIENVVDEDALHKNKAARENIRLLKADVACDFFDDDEIHRAEHTAFMLSEEFEGMKDQVKERFARHLCLHSENKIKEKKDGRI